MLLSRLYRSGCAIITPQSGTTIDASGYQYLTFSVKDMVNPGSCTVKVTFVDQNGNVSSAWSHEKTVYQNWTRIWVPVGGADGFDRQKISEIRLGFYWKGDYYIDDKSFYSGSIRWVSSGELKPKYLCETNQHISAEAVSSCNLREYPANTLLIAMYGLEATGVRGTASILNVPATISQACMAIQQTGDIDVEYLYYWYIYNGQWIGIRIAQGTKQQNLSTDTLGNLKIYAPSYSKQKEVCKLLSQIDNLIEKESQKIDLLYSVKKGLLQQLFI